MHRVKNIFLIGFLIFQLVGNAQVERQNIIPRSLNKEQQFNSLISLHKQLNAMNNSIPGYRLQIFFESGNYSKSLAMAEKEKFESRYNGYKAYISFNEPYYRVRVGDFRTKIEAIGFLKKILGTYPNAFEIKDRIYFDASK